MRNSVVVLDQVGSMPYPTGSTESMISIIAKRARGGKLALVERGSKNAMIIQLHPDDAGVATCDLVALPEKENGN